MYSTSRHGMQREPSMQDKYDRFEAWLRENGAQFELLELREYEDCSKPLPPPPAEDGEEKKEPTQPTEDSEMRGVHARRHIPPDTVCMSIPRRCLITVEMGQATPIGQAILNSDLELDAPKHIFLMIYILWDRKVNSKDSFFHPYYEILPRTLRNMPIFWDEEELDLLRGSYLLHQINDRNQAITEDYHAICQIAPLARICDLEEFKWARMCVCSRNFGLEIDLHRTSALVPHADMLNHYRPRQTKWKFDQPRQAFTITSVQHIPCFAQVYDSYGQKCNHRFLLNYGFAVEDNREPDGTCPNEVPIELFVDHTDALFLQKLEYWTRGELTGGTAGAASRLVDTAAALARSHPNSATSLLSPASLLVKRVRVCVSNNENTRLLFSLLRALACNAAELHSITMPVHTTTSVLLQGSNATAGPGGINHEPMGRNATSRGLMSGHLAVPPNANHTVYNRSCRDIRHPLSVRNEKEAMRILLKVIDRHLKAYPTSLHQDNADLRDEHAFPRFSNRRHAKIQVRGEKLVLHHFAQWAQTALDVLDVLEEELREQQGVEVQLLHDRVHVEASTTYDFLIQRMEDDVDLHPTIVRYCADVLGSLRREERKAIRRQQRTRGPPPPPPPSSTTGMRSAYR